MLYIFQTITHAHFSLIQNLIYKNARLWDKKGFGEDGSPVVKEGVPVIGRLLLLKCISLKCTNIAKLLVSIGLKYAHVFKQHGDDKVYF